MDWSVVSTVLSVLVVFGSISPQIVVGSMIDRRNRFDLVSKVSPSPPRRPPPPPPPMSPSPPPSPLAPPPPPPNKKKKSNITTNSASHAKGAKHPFSPRHPHHPHHPPKKKKMNIEKKIGLLFAGIAGIMQVAVFGFLGFRRWEISKIKDRHDLS